MYLSMTEEVLLISHIPSIRDSTLFFQKMEYLCTAVLVSRGGNNRESRENRELYPQP